MAMRKPTNTKLQEEVQVKLMRRLTEEGYSDLTDFWRRSGIQVSHETVRRALHGGKPTSIESIIKIGAHLGLTNAELADICRSLGDTLWPSKSWSYIQPFWNGGAKNRKPRVISGCYNS